MRLSVDISNGTTVFPGAWREVDGDEYIVETVEGLPGDYVDNGFGLLMPSRLEVTLREPTAEERADRAAEETAYWEEVKRRNSWWRFW